MVRDWVLNNLEELLGAVDASNEEFVEKLNWGNVRSAMRRLRAPGRTKLTHEAAESLKSTGYTNMRVDFDQNAFRGVYIHLKKASLVEGGVKKGEKALEK